MLHQFLRYWILISLFFILSTARALAQTDAGNASQGTETPHTMRALANPDDFNGDPLPGGCGRVTPEGGSLPLCCINGYVYLDGQPIASAYVQIENIRGVSQSLMTEVNAQIGKAPAYQVNLSAPPLSITVGEIITVTARYGDLEKHIVHVTQPGSQTIDVVLARNDAGQASNYIFERELWRQAGQGRLQRPHNLAVDSQDQLYVLDTDNARVQVFDSQGIFSRTWGTQGNQSGEFFSPMGIATDQSNNIYVADTANHRIQKFSRTGTHIMSIGSLGSQDSQLRNPEGVVVDRQGMIYVADSQNNRIQKFGADGAWLKTWGETGSGDGEFNYPTALALDRQGNLYVVDYSNHRVQKFTSDGLFLTKWGQLGQCIGANGCADGDFYLPDGIAMDANDRIYISDANHRIQVFTSSGAFLAKLGSRGTGLGQFTYPKGMTVDRQNHLYVADEFNDRVQKFDDRLSLIAHWGDQGDNAQQLAGPRGAAVASNGTLYIADTAHHRIQKFGADGVWQGNFGGQGIADGQFNQPQDVTLDSQGNLYVADTLNHRIQKFDSNGGFIKTWGSLGASSGQFNDPSGLALDHQDNVYVVDTFNHRIQKFTSEGSLVKSWGSQGSGNGQFNAPEELAIDGQGNVYVADTANHRIQKFTGDGDFIAQWGGQGGGDGQFDLVTGVAVDNAGNIFAADSTFRVQKFSGDGAWLATWGARGERPGHSLAPLSVTTGNDGRVYVSDTQNNRIQIFKAASYGKPIATITSISPPSRSLEANHTLVARGLGQDSDQTPGIAAYRWTALEDGRVLGISPVLSLPAAQLRANFVTLVFEVQDEEGEWSDPVKLSIFVNPPPKAPWTMLLYLAGDYHDEGSQFHTFNRVICQLFKRVASPNVRIAALVDGPGSNDTHLYSIDPTAPTECSHEPNRHPDGEQAMDNYEVLANFIREGQAKYPASNYYLAIANHGQAIRGIAWDTTSDLADDQAIGDDKFLTVKELGMALNAPGVAPVQVLHLDACSMNLLETVYELQMRTQILIASQYLGWDYFAYDLYAEAMVNTATPTQVAETVVSTYARLAEADSHPYTIAALDMQRADPALNAVNALAKELIALIQNDASHRDGLREIWATAPKFESNGNYQNDPLDMYVDLVQWTRQISQTTSFGAGVQRSATVLLQELIEGEHHMIIANRARSNPLPPEYGDPNQPINLDHANGLSIFYPGEPHNVVYESYITHLLFSFTEKSAWRDFLIEAVGAADVSEAAPAPLPPLREGKVFLPLIWR